MRSPARVLIATFLLLCAVPAAALSADPAPSTARLDRPAQTAWLPGLAWKSTGPFTVVPVPSTAAGAPIPGPYVTLQGTFVKKGWRLSYRRGWVPLQPDGSFQLNIALTGDKTPVQLMAVGPNRATMQETFWISTVNLPDRPTHSPGAEGGADAFTVTPGVGGTLVTYQEGASVAITAINVTAKLAVALPLSLHWDLASTSSFDALSIVTDGGTDEIRFLGSNLRIGYVLHRDADWKVALHVGGYFLTSFSNAQIGFENLLGPMLYPTARVKFGNGGGTLSFYFKFSPVSSGETIFDLANREMATGLAFDFPSRTGRPITVTVDGANDEFSLSGVAVSVNRLTLGLSYAF